MSNSLAAVASDVWLSQQNLVDIDDNKSLVHHIFSDENLFETGNSNEMEIYNISLSLSLSLSLS